MRCAERLTPRTPLPCQLLHLTVAEVQLMHQLQVPLPLQQETRFINGGFRLPEVLLFNEYLLRHQ